MKEVSLVTVVAALAMLISAALSEFVSGDFRRRFEEDERNQIVWREELRQKGITVDEDVQ